MEQYSQRLKAREARVARLDKIDARLGSARLSLGAAFLLIAAASLGWHSIAPAWIWAPVLAFIATVLFHHRTRAQRARAQHAVRFYRDGLARMRDEPGLGPGGERFMTDAHVYAADLDLFGREGLYPLLCAARTPMGEETLAQWLLTPASPLDIAGRQASIRDLLERVDLREDLAVSGNAERIALDPESLIAWARAPNLLNAAWLHAAGPLLAGAAIATCIVWAAWGIAYPLLAVILLEVGVSYRFRTEVASAIAAVENAHEALKDLASIIGRIEAEPFSDPALQALTAELSSRGRRAALILKHLATVVNLVESRRNPLLSPLMLLLMYPVLTAMAAERWRRAHGDAVQAWLTVVGRCEATISLARYAYEHPDAVFPEFVDGPACFRAEQLGHPLIPSAVRVRNDVEIAGKVRVLLVSGSNMSGKSTLLRTVGINTVLAMSGAPVCARRLELSPLQVGASIRVNDSLHEGSSRFYAEITRLRQLFADFDWPELFLLDELLQGTNSADRRVGAQGVIRALLERGAIGLVSTHDLALTELPGVDAQALRNVHFQDELEDGKLHFDFTLRDGVVTKSNGIALMRAIGLNV
jgi:hypothetical protein